MSKIKKGDEIIVIAGKDKGRRGQVVKMLEGNRLIVEGINMAKKHVKADPNRGVAGGIVDKEMPLQLSNVMLFNAESGKGERVGYKFVEKDGKQRKVRVFKSTGNVVDA